MKLKNQNKEKNVKEKTIKKDMNEKDIMNCIKKQGIAIIVLLSIILLVLTLGVGKIYFSNTKTTTSTETTETETETEYNTDYDVSMFKEIEAKDLKKQTKGKLSVVYIGRETCGWCAAFLPNLWQAQDDYKYKTLYIDIAKIIDFSAGVISDQDAYDTLAKLTGDEYDGYMDENLGATPMILIMKDNKIVGAQTGYSEYESFEKVLTDAGIKK